MPAALRERVSLAKLLITLPAILLVLGPSAAADHRDAGDPNDSLYRYQWGPRQVRSELAWHRSRGAGTVTAIVDSGIDLGHPDLAGKVIAGRTYLDCGRGGCGNGDWQSGPPDQRDGEPHGTYVAGIAGAATYNGQGVAGVAPAARLLAVRTLGDDAEGSSNDLARGIRFATDRGADVINLSLGTLPGSQAFTIVGPPDPVRRAIAYAQRQGVTVVAAAGNTAGPLCEDPGFAPGTLCVTATDRREERAAYANTPLKRDLKAVAAPGGSGASVAVCHEGVLSTAPAGEGQGDCGYPASEEYGESEGTSMAAPHVAGAAALLVAKGCDREQTSRILRETARNPDTGERGRFSPVYGYGIVDAAAATARAAAVC